MKRFSLAALMLLISASSVLAQDRVRMRDVEDSVWKLEFDLKSDADNALERVFLNAVDGLMDEIDIYFEFRDRGRLDVHVSAFGDEEDGERSDWHINRRGQLILGDSDHFDSDDTIWMREGDRLVPYEEKRGKLEREDSIYLKRVRR